MSTPSSSDPPGGGWLALLRTARPRATKANALSALLALSLGFAIATQVHQTQSQGLSTLREDELVRLLDDVQQDNSRLGEEITSLRSDRDKLLSGAAGSTEARKAAQQRVDSLGILAGTVAARGPGITIVINDGKDVVTAPLLLDALEELRDAGAEAVQIDGVRIVASSYFTDTEDGGVSVSGQPIGLPYRITVIGDPQTLATAMEIPGGVRETLQRAQAELEITRSATVTVTALHSLSEHRYARPVTPTSGSTP